MNKFSREVLKLIKTCNSATILDVDCEAMIIKLFNTQLQQELDKYEQIAIGKIKTKFIDLNAQDWDLPNFDFNKLSKYIDRPVAFYIKEIGKE